MPVDPLPLSAVLITFNTGDRLAPCLRSLAFADEIVVVDSGSDDATLDVARGFGARVVEEAWRGFGPQKRLAVSLARTGPGATTFLDRRALRNAMAGVAA